MKKKLNQMITFVWVGVINTMVGYGLFAAFIFLGLHYTIAVLFATCLGVLFNFKSTGTLVFQNKNNRLIWQFIGVYTIIYFVNTLLIKMINGVVNNLYFAGAIAVVITAGLSFVLNDRFVFRQSHHSG